MNDKSKTGLGGQRQGLQKIGRYAAVLTLALGVLLSGTAARQYDTKLTVIVTDCVTSQPIAGATVNVLTAAVDQGSQNLTTTNARGRAVIDPLRQGDRTHTVQVSAPGYKTVEQTQYMANNIPVLMNICLESESALPTETPTPTSDATSTPTATSTVDASQVTSCGSYLSEKVKTLVAPGDSAMISEGINNVARCMLQCRSTPAEPAPAAVAPAAGVISTTVGLASNYAGYYACFEGCADFGYFEQAAKAIVSNTSSTPKIITTLAELLSGAEGASCGDPGAFVFQLVKQLAIHGAQVNIVAVHWSVKNTSTANLWVSDKDGKQTGFLQDGSRVENIPDARAVQSGESKYVIIPVIPDLQIDLKSTAQGAITVEVVYTKNDTAVQDMAYYDIPVEPETSGRVDLAPAKPLLELDTPGLGTRSEPPDRFIEIPVISLPTETTQPTGSATVQPTATTTPGSGLLEKLPLTAQQLTPAAIAGAACCAGLLLALTLLGVAIWFRRRARRRVIQAAPLEGIECPRCGANCQADARFCYKCGLSFVQASAQQAAVPQAVAPRPSAPVASPPPARPASPPPPPPAAPVACTKCGQPLRATSKFCPKCGQPSGR